MERVCAMLCQRFPKVIIGSRVVAMVVLTLRREVFFLNILCRSLCARYPYSGAGGALGYLYGQV